MLHSICQQILKTQHWPQDWKRTVFIPIPKKANTKECSNYQTIALIWHASKGRRAGGEGDNRGWDGRMASPTRWTWVWVNPRSLWWTRRPGMLQFVGSQRVRHDWATELNWTENLHRGVLNLYAETWEKRNDTWDVIFGFNYMLVWLQNTLAL